MESLETEPAVESKQIDLLLEDPHGAHPIRAELFGLEHLENHARLLGEQMKQTRLEVGQPLLRRFLHNTRSLRQAYGEISRAYQDREILGHDAEWILDNYHIINDVLTEIRIDLPNGYYRKLPKLIQGRLSGFPRIYAVALELTAHCDSCLDENNMFRFMQAFQTVTPLTVGELWAFPIMLRLCLVDNLRRLAQHIVQYRIYRLQARAWVASHIPSFADEPNEEQLVLELMHPDWRDTYIVHLLEGLHDHEVSFPESVERIKAYLDSAGHNAPEIFRREKARQAANQVSIGNSVTSLRLLSALDWSRFFERTSLLEEELRKDPAGVYVNQDFHSRDRYRRVVEHLALRSNHSELEIAGVVLDMCRNSTEPSPLPIRNHVGYFLIDDGRHELEQRVGYRAPASQWLSRHALAHPRLWYFGAMSVMTLLFFAGLAAATFAIGGTTAYLVAFIVTAFIPITEISIRLLNVLVSALISPRLLPRMNHQEEVPEDCGTFIVIPCLLTRPHTVTRMVENLETHYLSNPDRHLYFALLTDFTDAAWQDLPEDGPCLKAAEDGIRALNHKYGAGHCRFFLCHRRRIWSDGQGCWMGWERKRGKLTEFNRLLIQGEKGSFSRIVGEWKNVPRIRFVITLDADTQLPREAARKLVATLAHPLNQPHVDLNGERIIRGYGILQPRIGLSLRGARKSLFARIYSGSVGLDPYTTAVSDTYQDIFGSGSFTGKGIYDLRAFEATTGRAFPDNRILSHDLIEGNYARSGLVSDVELLDDFPSHFRAYSRREHRWARGDWQIVTWLFNKVPDRNGETKRNPLPLLERWKILDNLRRCLLAPALVLLLLLGWTVLPRPWLATAFVGLVLAWPLVIDLFGWPYRSMRLMFKGANNRAFFSDFGATAAESILSGIFLLERARNMLDATGRTLYRLFVSRRRLLEWETSADAEEKAASGIAPLFREMWPTSVMGAALAGLLLVAFPASVPAASLFLTGWLLSPLVAFWVSRPIRQFNSDLNADEQVRLRRWARTTWSFFETFVGEEDHWLPPDNFQEEPKNEVAHRTSPTNIGLYLLSCVAAHDLGYITLPALLDRIEKSFRTLEILERAHGHFYNWYDTRNLMPLQPAYLSTVDSGNLAACFVALKQSFLEKTRTPVWGDAMVRGLADTLERVDEFLPKTLRRQPQKSELVEAVKQSIQKIRARLLVCPEHVADWSDWMEKALAEIAALRDEGEHLCDSNAPCPEEWFVWVQRLANLAADRREEFKLFTAGKQPPTEGNAILTVSLDQLVHGAEASQLRNRCLRAASQAETMSAAMDFQLLYNRDRELFAVGYNVSLGRIDNAHYDLLGSEACLTSFLAVARGDAPRKHWFQLGRPLTRIHGSLALLSWGGTMFEYLMPRLFLNVYPETLLDESGHAAVRAQIEYGRRCRKPWGISESAFNSVDGQRNYQYQAFGAPDLGLKRGLGQDLVVAPYATGLAAMIQPREAIRNYQRLCAAGAEGRCGLFEAIDYTADRLPQDRAFAVVKCFMAHHQGMTLLALVNCLLKSPLPRRFHSEPMVKATELLLQERVPRDAVLTEPQAADPAARPTFQESSPLLSRRLTTPHTAHPRTHLIASERYSVMITNAGSGQSRTRELAVTRWREDRTCDGWGQFFYIRDLRTGRHWSAGHQPLCEEADEYEVTFSTDKATFRRVDDGLETRTEITVSPENHAEVRRLTFTNHRSMSHYLEVTSYVELALAAQGADLAHPAFSKLFLETEYVAGPEALLCHRRPRSPDEKPLWAVHVLASEGRTFGSLQFETDRARFLGRGRTPADPAALDPKAGPLTKTTGPVLDPIFSLRRRIRVKAGASVSLAFTTAVVDSREDALVLADHFHDYHGINRAFELAWAHGQVELHQLHLTAGETHVFQRLAAHVLYAGPALRAASKLLLDNRLGQPALWRQGISGDLPIVLAFIADNEELPLARDLVAAHSFWRMKGLLADLVIINEQDGGYFEDFQQQIQSVVRSSEDRGLIDKPGGVHLRKATHIAPEDRLLLQAAAHCVLAGKRGSLLNQLDRLERQAIAVAERPSKASPKRETERGGTAPAGKETPLLFDNGIGGFTPEGREYVLRLPASDGRHLLPPQPWINVIANADFGAIISETGGGFTWAGNSQSNRLTPWRNDPVSDSPGEVVYLRDDQTGELWSATPAPLGNSIDFRVRHGQGYTIFEHSRDRLSFELSMFVPTNDLLKILRLKIRNAGERPRRISASLFVEWVLGRTREQTGLYIVTEMEPESGALLATNAFRPDLAARVSFVDVNIRPRTFTADRTEFLGRNGSISSPAALERGGLSGKIGAALDACAVINAPVVVPVRGETEIVFLLGEAANRTDVASLARQYKDPSRVQAAWSSLNEFWDKVLNAVTIRTPNSALDLVFNRWLPYQVLSCRMWARSALYQSGGAYGFRDQLQDSLALLHAFPDETRQHLLRAAGRQFAEGDVQHWWHPPSGAGVRTRISDDYLWLPYAVEQFVRVTGDRSLLEESVSFLRAPVLNPGQDEDYRVPDQSIESGTLYEHCLRAIEHGLRFGAHGLPLMGTGDWNDGMNRIGVEGRGESVWTGWFLYSILADFAPICESRGDTERAKRFREHAEQLQKHLEENAWDGEWYRRAYFDDGKPLGSSNNDECRIDSIVQSWAVISSAGNIERARQAMASVDRHLVQRDDKLVLLFTPPFDQGSLQPGYIKGYVPGIRENGGQYTHAALWVAQAYAKLGQGDKAVEILDFLNPIRHTSTPEEVERFKLEPYVVAADVYSQTPHIGRGGWSWYTGSAGWFYRVVLETLLGFERNGSSFRLRPQIPDAWPHFHLTYRYGSATYQIQVENLKKSDDSLPNILVDNQTFNGTDFSLVDDGAVHEIVVRIRRG